MRLAPVSLEIPASHGLLEALVFEPPEPVAAAVVCHPHPLLGGTMHNKVAYRLARGLEQKGVVALRFNFRGVGRSTGSHAGGEGEEEDVRSALTFLEARWPGLPLWLAGFSFGARVGLAVGAEAPQVEKLLGVGLALSMFDFSFLVPCQKPLALILAEDDEYGSGAETERFAAQLTGPHRLTRVAGAQHLFADRLPELSEAIAESIDWLSGAS